MKTNKITTKRFVIRKSLLGNNTVITFTNNKDITFTYDHDEIYSTFQEKFETMNCFQQYKSYTNSNCIPKFCRDFTINASHSKSVHSEQLNKTLSRQSYLREYKYNEHMTQHIAEMVGSGVRLLARLQTNYDKVSII